MKILPVALVLTLLPFSLVFGGTGAGDSLPLPARFDTLYIEDYKHLVSARLYGLIQDNRLVTEQEASGKVIFRPNLPFKLGVSFLYRWFGLGLSFYSPVSFVDEEKRGSTSGTDFRLNIYGNIYAVEAYFQRFRGFYISDFPKPGGGEYTNPDMMMYTAGIDGFYIYNYKKFSFRSAYFQNEWQKRSAGSLVARISLDYASIDDLRGIYPEEFILANAFDSLRNFTQASLFSVSVAPGYAYNLVLLKYCYLHAMVLAGPTYNLMTDRSPEPNGPLDVYSLQLTLRGALGYNGKKFHIGFSAILYGYQPLKSEPYNFYFDAPQFRLWAGTRFDLFRKKKN